MVSIDVCAGHILRIPNLPISPDMLMATQILEHPVYGLEETDSDNGRYNPLDPRFNMRPVKRQPKNACVGEPFQEFNHRDMGIKGDPPETVQLVQCL